MRSAWILYPISVALTKTGYLLTLLVGLISGYYAYKLNLEIPKPETLIEIGKYFFGFTGIYMWTITLNIIAFITVTTSGIATIVGSIKEIRGYDYFGSVDDYRQEKSIYWKVLFILFALIGAGSIFISIMWYLNYALILIGVLLVLSIAAYFIGSLSSRR